MSNKDLVRQYPVSRVKLVVEAILGKNISYPTWIRWQRFVGIPPRERFLTAFEAQCLFIYADLKKHQPRGCFSFFEVKKIVTGKKDEDFETQLRRAAIVAFEIQGSDLPQIIKNRTGREVSLSTLYYWGNKSNSLKFGLYTVYDAKQIEIWCNLAIKHKPKDPEKLDPIDLHKKVSFNPKDYLAKNN